MSQHVGDISTPRTGEYARESRESGLLLAYMSRQPSEHQAGVRNRGWASVRSQEAAEHTEGGQADSCSEIKATRCGPSVVGCSVRDVVCVVVYTVWSMWCGIYMVWYKRYGM